MLIYIQSIIAITLGCVAAVTDFKNKKIYNKIILIFICVSISTYMLLFKLIETEFIGKYLINFVIALIVSFLFFCFKIWAAGDAKLFLAIIFMIPFEIYEARDMDIFPALWILIIIFSIAFIYVVLETIVLWIKDKNKFQKIKIEKVSKEKVIENILYYFMGYFLITFINNIVYNFFEEFGVNNSGLLMLCNMLFLLFIYRIINTKKSVLIATIFFGIANIAYYCIYGFEFYTIDIKILVIVLTIILFRKISEQYNYEEIAICNLKPRMILSYGSIIKFYSSKVKGLPQETTENTDSRLTEEEVESIKRWSKTKKGTDTIVIVRHLPFAPFILLGEIIFLIIKVLI